jgi:hypothetical protein
MTSADPLPSGISPELEWADFWDEEDWPGEFKSEDWGLLKGRRVLLDYAAPALFD